MVPTTLLQPLARLRRRERLLALVWGAARWLAVVAGFLAVACLTDWLCDRWDDTPWSVRLGLFVGQLVIALTAAGWFVVRPLVRRLSDDRLAVWVEDTYPQLGQRLISALQLNRPDADTRGMSPELIGVVTREAEFQVRGKDFTGVADHRRLSRSAVVIAPVVVLAATVALVWPEMTRALLARQLLQDAEILRQITLTSVSPEVWPQGEQVVLRFHAWGEPLREKPEGEVRIMLRNGVTDRFVLEVESQDGDEAVYFARLPAMYEDFTYRAWLGDGRTAKPGTVRYVPRPVVTAQAAWVRLPDYCGKRPDGTPFEQDRPDGDLVALRGSGARVALRTQKPIARARVEVLNKERPPRLVNLALLNGRDEAAGTFPLAEGDVAYRLLVWDEYDFDNVPAPQRNIRLVAEDPPKVTLLREEFPPADAAPSRQFAEDYAVDGMPVPVGGRIRIAYECSGPYGLGRAELVYRVLKKNPDVGDERKAATPWVKLPLVEVAATPASGPFLTRTGAFQASGPRDQVPFHAVPSPDPTRLGRLDGGGRFDFQTKGIPDGEGGRLDLEPGDQVDFYVEVFPDRNPQSARPSGRSSPRQKLLVTPVQFVRWQAAVLREQQRLQELEAQQRGLAIRSVPAPQK